MRRLALLPLALATTIAAGCGFEREPPYAGARVPDVAPWSDLGPATFCDGDERVGAPSSTAAGFCVGADPPRACLVDGDCRSRERCTCGGCQVALCSSGD